MPPKVAWKDLMEPTRLAARSLVREGKVVVLQSGLVLGVDAEYRGPIRLRLAVESSNDD